MSDMRTVQNKFIMFIIRCLCQLVRLLSFCFAKMCADEFARRPARASCALAVDVVDVDDVYAAAHSQCVP